LRITSGFREVFAKQKFGKIQQEFSSKSLLNSPEQSESLQGVGRAKRRSRERGRSIQ